MARPGAALPHMSVVEAAPLVRDHAAERLREAIMTGRYPPGARLVERELCLALGVSRTSVREALRQLQSERLVEAADYSGSRVAVIDAEDAADLYALREMLESGAIRRFVGRADADDVARLGRLRTTMGEAVARGDRARLTRIAGQFYATILEGAGSRILQEVAGHLLARTDYLRFRPMSEPGRLEEGLAEWDAILAAVRLRDADAASDAISRHLRRSRDAVVARLVADEEAAGAVRSQAGKEQA